MKTTVSYKNKNYRIDLSKPMDISIPLRKGLKNPNAYYSEPPEFNTIKQDDFIGSVNLKGKLNHKKLIITPHGNGTHTECSGHISKKDVNINQCLDQFFFLAQLISVKPLKEKKDLIIRKKHLEKLVDDSASALIIRTLPNSTEKLMRNYSGTNAAYFDPAAIKFLVSKKINHLLIDLPSVDKEADGGKLLSHKAFWDYPKNTRKNCTITEMIYVPDKIKDGFYFLNLQIISLESDASPSKPILFSIDSAD